VRHKDGSWRWIADRGLARRDAQGRVRRMAGSATDITDRKRAEDAMRRVKRAIATSCRSANRPSSAGTAMGH